MNFVRFILFGFSFVTLQVFGVQKQETNNLKPRVIVLTDVSTWETDDSESLVRLLVHADLIEIEGIIYTTGWSHEILRDDFIDLIHGAITAYEKDLSNLIKRSVSSDVTQDETRQQIGYWPSPDYLRKRTVFGSKQRGIDKIGKDNVSDGSNLIIALADENDERPLWILLWGGGNTLAQAIWQVQQDRSEEELLAFLHKIPTYAITDQDRSYKKGTPYKLSAHQWLRKEFEKDLMFLWDECAWKYQNGKGRDTWSEYEKHIQSHGNLGKEYPKYKYGVEGDTPAFLHLLPNGLNNPMEPEQVGWGGYFQFGLSADDTTNAFTNHKGKANEICMKYQDYFYPATFNNFVARMDWADNGKGNRNPIIVLNGSNGIKPIRIVKKPGEMVNLDASESYDPDNNQLHFKWWILSEAGTYQKKPTIPDNKLNKITIQIPGDSAGTNFHVICEVNDNGEPNLTSYRRIIIHSKN